MPVNEALIRGSGIVNPDSLKPVNIIGCGSIGSFTALALAKVGFSKFTLYDDDVVAIENIGPQMFGWKHLGMPKVEAVKDLLMEFTTAKDISCVNARVTPTTKLSPCITVSAVDSMTARTVIWSKVKNKTSFFVDGRIGGEVIRIFSVRPREYDSVQFYESTLYKDSEAVDLPCTQRNVAYIGFLVAGIICNSISKYCCNDIVVKEVAIDTRNVMGYTVE